MSLRVYPSNLVSDKMKEIINLINNFFDVLWIPLSKFPPYIDIVIISAISALLFLLIFKKTSNQEMIKYHKGRIIAHILQIRLYKDRPLITIKSIINILVGNLMYLRFNLVPLIIIILPVIIISIQLNNRYGYLPIKEDNSFVIRVNTNDTLVKGKEDVLKHIVLHTSPGIQIETLPVKIEADGSIFWRAKISGSINSNHILSVSINGAIESIEKTVSATDLTSGISPVKSKFGIENIFLNNAEGFIPDDSVFRSITINYNLAEYPFLYWNFDPILLYFIFTLIIAFIVKPFIKVTI